MLNTRRGTHWTWLDYQRLLGTMSLTKRFVTSFRKLAWTYAIVTFRLNRLKDKNQTMVKFTNRKDCLWILKIKRQLNDLDPATVDLPERTKIFFNESLWPYYRGIWNKCKKLRGKQKVHQYYTINGLIRLRIEESGQAKMITHMVDLKSLFPDIEIGRM